MVKYLPMRSIEEPIHMDSASRYSIFDTCKIVGCTKAYKNAYVFRKTVITH